jgi:hypothetical protein
MPACRVAPSMPQRTPGTVLAWRQPPSKST